MSSISPDARRFPTLCCGGYCLQTDSGPRSWSERAGICREKAEEARQNAVAARTPDVRRSWVQIMRDWDASAAQADVFARTALPGGKPGDPSRCFCAALFAVAESEEPQYQRLYAMR